MWRDHPRRDSAVSHLFHTWLSSSWYLCSLIGLMAFFLSFILLLEVALSFLTSCPFPCFSTVAPKELHLPDQPQPPYLGDDASTRPMSVDVQAWSQLQLFRAFFLRISEKKGHLTLSPFHCADEDQETCCDEGRGRDFGGRRFTVGKEGWGSTQGGASSKPVTPTAGSF